MPVTDTTAANGLDNCTVFPVEEIVQYPLPGYGTPTAISFSPDDSLIAYLFSPDLTLNRKLFVLDPKSGKHDLFFSPPDGGLDENNLSADEKLRRERLRERGLGMTHYEPNEKKSNGPSTSWGVFPNILLCYWFKSYIIMENGVAIRGQIYLQDAAVKPELKIPSVSSSPIIDPHISPDGTNLAYVRNNELHVLNLLYNMSKQLTVGANKNTITHGLAEFIAQVGYCCILLLILIYVQQFDPVSEEILPVPNEEMDQKNGFWWSPDSNLIAFTEVDSSEIPLFRIMHQDKNSVGSDVQEDHAYPFAGGSNVKVRLGVISANGGPVSWMDLVCGRGGQENDEEYLARVNWMHGDVLTAQVLNRTHTKLKLLKFDIKTGPITEGDWMVEQVAGVNEASGLVYFTGTLDGPLESHLYCTNLFPDASHSLQAPLKLTHGKGKHLVVIDHQLQSFVDIHDSLDSPPKITVALCLMEA
ncbi:hypothetical protein Sango_2608800 [Sesamum angolense]|uniref:Dipeptidylpeptidase IV N-terminal domain-containing protein n=1 Tax=Sesamum angolense TaxID=2727404 RepID=A0AAE1VZE7_9LAMI|nr:hypothetical protein Sango_2608800 [Sesamum angolense]